MKKLLLLGLVMVLLALAACGTPVATPVPSASPTPTAESFTPLPTTYALYIGVTPEGSGSVTPSGGKYELGVQVNLKATPADGFVFDYWDGSVSGYSDTVSVSMNSFKNVTAHFKAKEIPTPTPSPTPTPTPTPFPTPTPTYKPGYDRSNPVGIGTPLTTNIDMIGRAGDAYNNYEVRVTLWSVVRGDVAWKNIVAENQFNDPPKPGYEYIMAKVRFEYLVGPSPNTTCRISTSLFTAVSSDGKDYDNVPVVEPEPSIDATLYPGAYQQGWMVFLVSEDDVYSLLTIGRDYDGTGGIWFKLY